MPDPPKIRIRRVYDAEPKDRKEVRVLVDRLWPRGMKKDALKLDRWDKELAPSNELRRWFAHDPEKWEGFQSRYRIELADHTDLLRELATLAVRRPVVLLYGARDRQHNEAVVLKEVLEEGIQNS